LKTFYTGIGGWADKQLPDGTIEWTAPTGHTYATKPVGALFFPTLATHTGRITLRSPSAEPGEYRGLMMPKRKRTRHQERRGRITAERAINEARITDEKRQHQAWLAATYEPPPF
jgi:hypothetical protein